MVVKVCKFQNMFCTPALSVTETTLCEEFNMVRTNVYNSYGQYCPDPGNYKFSHTFQMPYRSALTDLAWRRLGFNVYVDLYADDTTEDWSRISCHAHFTTVDYDWWNTEQDSMQYGMGMKMAASAIGIAALVAYGIRKRRQWRSHQPSLDLGDDDSSIAHVEVTSDFEMIDSGNAVRV